LVGVGPGDEVIVPSLTFIAPVNAISYNNARPIFMDSDEYYNIDINKTIDFLENETFFKSGFTYNKKTKNRIAAIIPVHMWGNAVDLFDLIPLCKKKNIFVVEDASESLGTVYKKDYFSKKHSGTFGDIGCISFNGNKIITSGGGGMIITDNQIFADKARYLTTQAKDDPIRYIHNEIGYNFRLTNIQAALGVAQLEKLSLFLKRKRKVFKTYKANLDKMDGLKISDVPNYADNNHWMTVLKINIESYGIDREQVMKFLQNKSIQTRPVWAPIHLQKPYSHFQRFKMERCEKLVESSLCLPSSTGIEDKDLNYIIDSLKENL
jgi:perosamine synthetase